MNSFPAQQSPHRMDAGAQLSGHLSTVPMSQAWRWSLLQERQDPAPEPGIIEGRFSRARAVLQTRNSSLRKAFALFTDSRKGRTDILRCLLNFLSIQAGEQNPGALDHPRFFLTAPAHRRQLGKCFRRAFQGGCVSGYLPNILIQ